MNLRWWHFCIALAVSLALHGAVDVWLSSTEDPVQVAGSANAQIAIIGNATADMMVEGGEFEAAEAAPVTATQANPVAQKVVRPVVAETPVRAVQAAVQPPQAARTSMAAALPASESALPIIAAAPVDVTDAEQVLNSEAAPVAEPSTVEAADASHVDTNPAAQKKPERAVQADSTAGAAQAATHAAETAPQETAESEPVETSAQKAHLTEQQKQAEPITEDAAQPERAVVERSIAVSTVRAVAIVDPLHPATKAIETATTVKPIRAQPVQAVPEVRIEEVKPVETAALIRPVEPVAKPVEKPAKKRVKKPAKKKSANKGNKGSSRKDAKKGRADGEKSGARDSAGDAAKGNRRGVAGNAAVSNYPGKVRRKLRRALHYPKKARAGKLRGTAHVRFVVNASGRVTVTGIARSSGSAVLDAAALATVKRAAPFPKIPAAANRRSWSFTIPLEFKPRR